MQPRAAASRVTLPWVQNVRCWSCVGMGATWCCCQGCRMRTLKGAGGSVCHGWCGDWVIQRDVKFKLFLLFGVYAGIYFPLL